MNRVWILVVATALIGLGAFTACGYGNGYYDDYYYDDYYDEDCYCDYFGCDCYYYKPGVEPPTGEVW